MAGDGTAALIPRKLANGSYVHDTFYRGPARVNPAERFVGTVFEGRSLEAVVTPS